MQGSSEPLVAGLFPPKQEKQGGGGRNKFKGVVVQFSSSMSALLLGVTPASKLQSRH